MISSFTGTSAALDSNCSVPMLNRSAGLHRWTELPGQYVSNFAADVIRTRYEFAHANVFTGSVLEVGCGPGAGLRMLQGDNTERRVIGLEYSARNIELGCQHHEFPVVRGDAEHLPFQGRTFDSVISLAMIYYLQFDQFAKEVRRVLRPGGNWLFCMSNCDVPGFVPAEYTTEYLTVPDLSARLQSLGFSASFSGGFPAAGGSHVLSTLRAGFKNSAKMAVSLLPGGKSVWQRLRRHADPPTVELPKDFSQMKGNAGRLEILPRDRRDHIHRVIYVSAHMLENL